MLVPTIQESELAQEGVGYVYTYVVFVNNFDKDKSVTLSVS